MTATTVREIPFARPWITDDERAAVNRVLGGPILTHGPEGQAFEGEFADFLSCGESGAGSPHGGPEREARDSVHCVSLSSCMAALHLAYIALEIGPGDEVIVPAQTHVATAHAVEWVGARPIFVDCDRRTGNVTPDAIAAAVTPRTRAIAVVHFLGIPCDMPRIMAVAAQHGLRVVEDCALAIGATTHGQHVGLFGDAGCFSFYPTKHITTGEGGMLVSRDPAIAARAARLRAFGVDRSHAERSRPGMYEVPGLGLNYRMSELQAAIGRVQLRRIAENLRRRRTHFSVLRDALTEGPGVHVLDADRARAVNSHYCLSVVLEGERRAARDEVVGHLRDAGIGTSVYYPEPVPRMRYYRDRYGYDPGLFPHAAEISDGSIALPVGPHLADDDVAYMADVISARLGAAPTVRRQLAGGRRSLTAGGSR